MRDLTRIIGEIIVELPEGHDHIISLLKSVLSSAIYSSPELMGFRWMQVSNILNDYIPYPPEEEWQKNIDKIFSGEEK